MLPRPAARGRGANVPYLSVPLLKEFIGEILYSDENKHTFSVDSATDKMRGVASSVEEDAMDRVGSGRTPRYGPRRCAQTLAHPTARDTEGTGRHAPAAVNRHENNVDSEIRGEGLGGCGVRRGPCRRIAKKPPVG